MRKKIFAANWKMHLGPKEAAEFCVEFLKITPPDPHREWVIFPPAISLTTLQKSLKDSMIHYGGQNCYFESKGAFTGEISPGMLKEVGSTYCLVGHSERRHLFGDTDQICAKKVKALLEVGIIPMLCVGETQKERESDQTRAVLQEQLAEGLSTWSPEMPLTIAYEPVWAIGTGKVATPQMAEQAHVEIRQILADLTKNTPQKTQRAAEIQILYGGSV